MAHYAELDQNNVVLRVIVGVNEGDGNGETLYQSITGTVWKRTSYNTYAGARTDGGNPFRKNYAGEGFTYDPGRDAFIPPKPYESWVLNEFTCQWEAPYLMPINEHNYVWDEASTSWVVA